MTSQVFFEALWPLALLFPLVLAVALVVERLRPAALALTPLGALPALGLAVFPEPGGADRVEMPWLLLGTVLGLTETTRVFLLFTAVLWTLAALYGRSHLSGHAYSYRFFAFFLVTMTGNLGLIMARDLASFYLLFTLVSFAAYGMIVYDGTDRARYAARVYLIMTIIGEAFVLPAVLVAAASTGTLALDGIAADIAASPARDTIVLLTLLGFGVKAGALTLHMWLPLAYSAAPTPASAVLSGPMIKAGLLGWLTFIPAGEAELVGWGLLVATVGGVAAFYGVLVGLVQEESKTVLAYSSISQMGFMMVGLGAGLTAPGSWPVALTAVTVYAAHHALAKSALFLGVGVAEKVQAHAGLWRVLVIAGLLLCALAIAGAPLTSGAAGKQYLQDAAELAPGPWGFVFYELLSLAAIGSTLIMIRFLVAAWPERGAERGAPPMGLFLPWAVTLAGVAGLVLLVPGVFSEFSSLLLSSSSMWPVAAGAALAGGAWLLRRRVRPTMEPTIPEGDLLVPVTRSLEYLSGAWSFLALPLWRRALQRISLRTSVYEEGALRLQDAAEKAETRVQYWIVAGTLTLLLAGLLLVLAALAAW